MSTLTRVILQPNWLPSLNPPWYDLSDRVLVEAMPRISSRVQRAEDPNVLMHSQLGFSFQDYDNLFASIFSLDKIQGTNPASLRAPLLHFGRVLLQQQKRPGGNWKNSFFGYVEPTSVKRDSEAKTAGFTAYSAGKQLDLGNAERVHRLASICQPAPYIMFGFDLTHPANLPGQSTSDSCWKLAGGAALQFFAGDVFQAVAKIVPAGYAEGMQVNDLGSGDQTVARTVVSGADLFIFTVESTPGLVLTPGQAVMNVITPWYHNKNIPELNQLLVDEVNAAMAAAGDTDSLTLEQDAFSASLGQSAVDLIDGNGINTPITGAGWYVAATASGRALATAAGSTGTQKADILQDAVSTERTFSIWSVNTATLIAQGVSGHSADYNLPQTYPNPTRALPGSPAPTLANAPAPAQSRVKIQNAGLDLGEVSVISTAWHVTPPSLQSAPAALKRAYRIEHSESAYSALIGPPLSKVLTFFNPRRLIISLYSTVNDGATWTLVSSAVSNLSRVQLGAQPFAFEDDNGVGAAFMEPGAQPFLSVHAVGGGLFLYLLLSPGNRQAYWRVGTIGDADGIAPASLMPGVGGLTAFGAQPGGRSGSFTDGTNIFFLDDSSEVKAYTGPGTIAWTSGTNIITGTGVNFITQGVQAGDQIQDIATGLLGNYTVAPGGVAATTLTLTANISEANGTGVNYVLFGSRGLTLYYWNGAAMVAGTLVGFPVLNGADFQGAVFDTGRGKLYVMQAGTLFEIACSFAAGTLTATAVALNAVDTPNYDPSADFVPFGSGSSTPVNRAARIAWLTGPVDVVQGAGASAVNYPIATNALLIATETQVYVYSDQFGGVVKIADFTGLSCSQAMASMAQITQQFITAGPDQSLVAPASLGTYLPAPVVRLKKRIRSGAPDLDLVGLAASSNAGIWMVQYADVRVQNSKGATQDALGRNVGGTVAEVRNDQTFTYGGITYQVAAVRYGGAGSLAIDNPFIFTVSIAKQLANADAFEFLLPRASGKLRVFDPFLLNDTTTVEPLMIVAYLVSAPDSYSPAVTAQGRVLAVDESPTDDIIGLEIA